MNERILWLDNDPAYLEDYVDALKKTGYRVDVVTTVSTAERLIDADRYDLLLLDVMIPTKTEAEENLYPPETTDSGLKTGLIFFQRMKEKLAKARTPVIVMTVRLDSGILEGFVQSGLSQDNFCTKMSLRETPVFLEKVRSVLTDGQK